MTLNLSYKSIAWFVLSMTALGVVVGFMGPRVGALITGSLALIAGIALRVSALAETAKEKKQEEARIKKVEEQREFAERIHREAELKREQWRQEEERARVHVVEADDGYVNIEWREQLDEVKQAWANGDYDFARTWLQKMAYSLTSANAPQEVHDKFKTLMVAFTRDDPLYADVMRVALPAIVASPGVVQSELSKRFPQFDAEQFRYALYYAEQIGDVARVKKGRSYALTIT